MRKGVLMKFSEEFIKESFDKAMEEEGLSDPAPDKEAPEAVPEVRIKKKPGPKPGFKRKPKTPDTVSEKNCGKTAENVREKDENVRETAENVLKTDDSDMKIYKKDSDLHIPVQSKELVRKQLEEDLVIIAKEVNELLDRRDAIRKFLKSWE